MCRMSKNTTNLSPRSRGVRLILFLLLHGVAGMANNEGRNGRGNCFDTTELLLVRGRRGKPDMESRRAALLLYIYSVIFFVTLPLSFDSVFMSF